MTDAVNSLLVKRIEELDKRLRNLEGQERAAGSPKTFTPHILGLTTSGTGTYTTQMGFYQVIGGIVHIKMYLQWTAHTGSGNMAIGGLPYMVSNDFGIPVSVWWNNLSLAAAGNKLIPLFFPNTTQCRLYEVGNGAYSAFNIDTSGDLVIAGFHWKA